MRFALILCCLAFLGSCDSSAPNSQSSRIATEVDATPVAKHFMVDIPQETINLDENDPSAAVSLARNIYFIFDGSGSMADPLDADCVGQTSFSSKLEGAQWAIAEFLTKIPDQIQIGLLIFDDSGTREAVPLGVDNRQKFLTAIQTTRAAGGTPLAGAMRYATERLVKQYQHQLGYGEFRIVVVTDGLAKRIPEAATYAMSHGFPIYAIGLCVKANHPLREYAISYRAADSFEDLARGLEETLAELPAFDVQTFDESP